MKRYDLFSVSDYQTDSRFEVHESEEGYYVPYHEIQSDRALLEEAVALLQLINDVTVWNGECEMMNQIKSIIARAGEMGIKRN